MKKISKRGYAPASIVVTMVLLVVFGAGMFSFAGKFNEKADDETAVQTCRMTMLLNAKIRGSLLPWNNEDEKVAINCPIRKPAKEISYGDVSSFMSTTSGIKYNIMKEIADVMLVTNHRTIGDMEDAIPFRNDKGIYCVFDKKITFDKGIRKRDELGNIDDFMSFLINTKDHKTGRYYSDMLYGYEKKGKGKITFSDAMKESLLEKNKGNQDLENELSRMNLGDISIDTSKDYYSTHLVIKGEEYYRGFGKRFFPKNRLGKTFFYSGGTAVVSCGAIALAISGSGVGIVPGMVLGAFCVGSAWIATSEATNAEIGEDDVMKLTLIVPVDEIDKLGCTERYI